MRSPASPKPGRRRQERALFVALTAGVAMVGCSLFVDTSGLSDGTNAGDATTTEEAGADARFDAALDDAADASAPSDAGESDGAVVSLEACVLLLHLDEPTWAGPASVHDSSGQNNSGTPINGAVPTPSGKFGGAALLDGTNWIDIPASASLDGPLTQVTYTAWIYPTALSDGGTSPGIISKRQSYAMNVAYTLFLSDDNHAFFDLEGSRGNSAFSFTNGVWAHVAVVFDGTLPVAGSRVAFYVNGVLDNVSSADTALAANTQDILIGNLLSGGDKFIGRIDEVAIWNRALTGSEISALAKATKGL